MRNSRFYVALFIVVILIGVSVPAQAEGQGPAQVGLRPDAPDYAKHGPFWVGTQDLRTDTDPKNPVDMTIWYPALNPTGAKESTTYSLLNKFGGIPKEIKAMVLGHALRDAAPDKSKGPYPLVVLSHGFSVSRQAYAYLVEHFTSYGFVVIAPEHQETLDAEFSFSELWKASIDRPRVIRQVLDYAEKLTATNSAMKDLIDMKQVAVIGHSYGGYTALVVAGARIDLKAFNARCAALASNDPNKSLCTPLVPHEQDMAKRGDVVAMSDGLWPSWQDPRIRAIIPMAGDSYLFDKSGLASISVPVFAMGGTADTGTPYLWGAAPTYDFVTSAQKTLVTFTNAEHFIFLPGCDEVSYLIEAGYSALCSDPVWDINRAHDLINHFTTAFLLDILKGDKDAHKALLPDAVKFPGIEYKTTLK